MKPVYLAGLLLLSAPCLAQTVNLVCVIDGDKQGERYESRIDIDPVANYMRVNGDALPLSMTDEAYSSRSRQAGAFLTIRRIDRISGEITVGEFYEGRPFKTLKGKCEKTERPAATKF